MSTATDYLDKVIKKYNIKSKNQLAIFLNTSRQRINGYYNQGNKFDLEMTLMVADALEINMDEIAIKQGYELHKNGKNGDFWKKKLKDINSCLICSFVGFVSFLTYTEYYILCQIGKKRAKRPIKLYQVIVNTPVSIYQIFSLNIKITPKLN